MRLIHRRDGDAGDGDEHHERGTSDQHECVLAEHVDTADSLLAQARGLMFRRSVPSDYALVFRFDRATRRGLHMLFVPFDIDAVWVREGEVTEVKRLAAWYGLGWGVADTIVELPAGAAADVNVGDTVRLEGDSDA